mmetsp:Transcript_84171/g.214277  ORF Transcript_84171/g.214277 Transcript_84171/m.214277 type:complete len:104 (+) Transcript_84171:39-350(+)
MALLSFRPLAVALLLLAKSLGHADIRSVPVLHAETSAAWPEQVRWDRARSRQRHLERHHRRHAEHSSSAPQPAGASPGPGACEPPTVRGIDGGLGPLSASGVL